ncbi:hypothetical protein KKG72_07665 [bacterium]|nr:hypothetical protein [bacterium]
MKNNINLENIAIAIDIYRSKNGRNWKSKFNELYSSGKNTSTELQQFKNKFNFETLDKIKYHTTKSEIQKIVENN